ncbi:MAG: hypothetical protein IT233_00965 [Bacteroidia bacterium]|nr:hypothetical protein [Bacteroidia bacterium]
MNLRFYLIFTIPLSLLLLSSCREEICLCEKRGKREYKKVEIKYKRNRNGGYKRKSYRKLSVRYNEKAPVRK